MSKFTAIYVRRSVSASDKGNNSLSIESQINDCVNYLNGDKNYHVYCDDGKSGKDIAHRPEFQQMMIDAHDGLISRIIVKKYDRFSRNARENLNIIDELDKLGVSVYSLTEPFNTETKEGRMMRNNIMIFAEFERETIAARVADAYNTKAHETGFYQGGKTYYGYKSVRQTINGKTGSVLVPSDKTESVKIAYKLYQQPNSSLRGIIKYLVENNIEVDDKFDASHLSRILCSPLYVRADKEVYTYLTAKGYEIIDNIDAFDGVHGLFQHKTSDGIYIKVGYHEGLVDSDVWLSVQDKKSRNVKIPNRKGGIYTWLSGLIKCADCGYAVCIQRRVFGNKEYFSLRDKGRYMARGCRNRTFKIRPHEVEEIVLDAMKERVSELEIKKSKKQKTDSEVENLTKEIIELDTKIKRLVNVLADSDDVSLPYINAEIKNLALKKDEKQLKLNSIERRHKQIDTAPLLDPLACWEDLSIEDKNVLAKKIIEIVTISDESGIQIKFSI